MPASKATVSIGLPVAQEPVEFIRRAVQSVFAQSMTDWELIVVADGVPAATLDYLRSIEDRRVRVVAHSSSKGLATRLNEIAVLAEGEYLARFDADDIMFPHRIEHQLQRLQDSGVDVLSGRAVLIDQDGSVLGVTHPVTKTVSVESMLAATPFIHPTVFARTEWFRQHPYDESLLRCQDKALWIASAGSTTYERDQEPVLFYRVARHHDSKKYARSVTWERKIIRAYGPAIVGRVKTGAIIARSLVKQVVIDVASKLNKGDSIMARRYATPSNEEARGWATVLSSTERTIETHGQGREEKK